MKKYLIAYLGTGVVFLALDALWLGVVARSFFRDRLTEVLSPEPNMTVAAVFYLIFVIGVLIFAVEPAFRSGSWVTATVYGALFGFFVYATYDLTNQATLKDWPLSITFADIPWGAFVTATGASAGFLVASRIG